MKKILLCAAFIAASFTGIAQVGIGTTTPDASAALDIESTTKGFLPPRMDTAARNAIVAPVAGLVIYNTFSKVLEWFDGTNWTSTAAGTVESSTNSNLTVASVIYQGTSVINNTGIGYNGEAVPSASTITVRLSNAAGTEQIYGLSATDAVSGLVYSASGTIAASASNIDVILTHNAVVMPDLISGVLTMALTGTGSTFNLEPRIDIKSIPASTTTVTDVVLGTQTWMDRNLGARRLATAIDDGFSYGNYYQWGRPADGHEITVLNGTSTSTGRGLADATVLEALATTDAPGHANFITTNIAPQDWRDDNNDNRWFTANTGPCPANYHVPTADEWETLLAYIGAEDTTELYESAIKTSLGGRRVSTTGDLTLVGGYGYYWSSDVDRTGGAGDVSVMYLTGGTTGILPFDRTRGLAVRCIKTPAVPESNLTVASPTYQGTSVIDATGIGYNGEAVPAASTITVQLTNNAATGTYNLSATDAVSGLIYSASGTIAASTTIPVILTPNTVVMPDLESGDLAMPLLGTISTLNLAPRIDIKSIPASATTITDVDYGGQTWMDRNLGARQVANAINDVFSYGNYYQWGRPADGHEITVWNGDTKTAGRGLADVTADLAADANPSYDNFITTTSSSNWLATPATSGTPTLWATANQGPCPANYHVPTSTEWNTADTAAFGSQAGANGTTTTGWDNNTETYESTLKLPSAGRRGLQDGTFENPGTAGAYWSSNIINNLTAYHNMTATGSGWGQSQRGDGIAVRCLKD
jgi:uncharacterized protein (TIGR02145 family)